MTMHLAFKLTFSKSQFFWFIIVESKVRGHHEPNYFLSQNFCKHLSGSLQNKFCVANKCTSTE